MNEGKKKKKKTSGERAKRVSEWGAVGAVGEGSSAKRRVSEHSVESWDPTNCILR